MPRRDGGRSRQRSPGRSGAYSPSIGTCSGHTVTRCGWTTRSPTCSAFDERLTHRHRRPHFTTRSRTAWRRPGFRPRALFERFNIEVLATTESPLDPLLAPPGDPRRLGLEGSGDHRLPARSGRRPRVRRASRPGGPAGRGRRRATPTTWSGYLRAREPAALLQRRWAPPPPTTATRRARRTTSAAPSARRSSTRVSTGALRARGGRALSRPDADRDGADEHRRRPGDADPPGRAAQPQPGCSSASAATRAPTSRCRPTTSRAEAAARPLRQRPRSR